jgi:hypothetical protein
MAATLTAHLGIDIAKATFDVALLTADGKIKAKRFDNSQTGFCRLERWLKHQFVTDPATLHVCMEAPPITGKRSPATCRSVATASAWSILPLRARLPGANWPAPRPIRRWLRHR